MTSIIIYSHLHISIDLFKAQMRTCLKDIQSPAMQLMA